MDFDKCLQYISDWYFSDTIELLDMVLDDNADDPQYSAITTLNRLWIFLQYQQKIDTSTPCKSVASLLKNSGYTAEDIALFANKVRIEQPFYSAEILTSEFLEK